MRALLRNRKIVVSLLAAIVVVGGIVALAAQNKPKNQSPPQESSAVGGIIASLTNNNPSFRTFENVPSASLDINALTQDGPASNGHDPGQGKFRTSCVWSHFAYDDPIVKKGQPGASHLHMFFGNTKTDAYTTQDSLVNSGGSSCLGNELNRTGYWIPALLDGQGNVKIPFEITIYYKSKDQSRVKRMPQGLQMIAGEFTGIGNHTWSCGGSDSSTNYNYSQTIPQCGSDYLHGAITFPDCWNGRDLHPADPTDHISHMAMPTGDDTGCPPGYDYHMPQVQYEIYWANPGDTSGWYLSSDRQNGANYAPGSTLHGDWWGGWNDQIMDTWINGCVRASEDCSLGETGTSRMLRRLLGPDLLYGVNYTGQTTLPLAEGSGTTPNPTSPSPTPPSPSPNPSTNPTPPPPTPQLPVATPGAQNDTQNPPGFNINADTFTSYGDGSGNLGSGQCRPDAPNADLKAGAEHCDIGWFDPGDWYEWTVKAPAAGRYSMVLSYGHGEPASTGIRVSVNGTAQINKTNLPTTGGWETHMPTVIGEIVLTAGENKIRLDQAGYMDIDYMAFALQGTSTAPTPPTPSPTTPTPSANAGNPADKYSHPNVRYVSKNGNNSNNGSSGSPWQTIQHAIDNSPGDTLIRVQPGTYNENLEIVGKTKVTLVGDGSLSNKPYIIGNDYTIVHIANSTYITVDNFKIEATTPAGKEGNWGGLIGINSDSGAIGDVHHIAARNNEMIGVASSPGGFRTSNKSGSEAKVIDYLTVEDNTIHGKDGQYLAANFGGGGSGISMFELKQLDSAPGPHVIIRRNFIYRVSQVVNSTLIGSNEITDGNGIIFDGNDFNNYRARVDVYQNIVTDVGATGMHAYKSSHEINYFNNTIVDYGRSKPSTAGIGMDGGAQRAWNNVIIGGSKKHPSIVGSGQTGANIAWETAGGSHSINIDPQLQNPFDTNHSVDDFTPKASSPIGANANANFGGIASGTTDFYGANQVAAWFGAIAVGSSPTPTPSPSPSTDPHSGHSGSTDPKAIVIRARGNQGDETMELWVNGQQQMVFNNVAKTDTDYTHVLSAETTIDTIEVKFTNDNGAQGPLDRWLVIDGITINGTKYESEAPTTKSNGVYDAANGCAEGYKNSEYLVCDGWLRYEAAKGVVIGGSSTTAPECTAANPLTMSLKPEAAGKYTIWARINVRNNVAKPTLNFGVGGKCLGVNVNNAVNTWAWVKLGSDIDLQSATQDLKVYAFLDSDVWVDKALFTFDNACTPTGDNAQGCVVDRIEAKVLGITQGQIVTRGTPINVSAEVLGIKSGTPSVAFSIDGTVIAENIKVQDSVYCMVIPANNACGSFSTSGLSVGTHTISLSASDSGRIVTVARTFTVNESGTTPNPTPPSPSPTPTPPSPTPTPAPPSGTVSFEAESFTSYNDNSPGNLGTGTCRSENAPNADMKPTGSGGCTIGWIDPGDWYEWTVTVPAAGNYTLAAKYANGETANTSVKFSVDGVLQITNNAIASTGNWETLKDGTLGVLTLKAGENKIRFDQTGWIDFDVFTLTPGGTATLPNTNPSTIVVKARGFVGEENIALKINDKVVATWNNISIAMTDYTFSATAPTVIDSIRVEYTNDDNSVPKNVQVDGIVIDGVKYESEAAQTYSVGSWNPSTGCEPGFKTNEYISCPGYLEYQAAKGVKLAMGTSSGGSGGGTPANGEAKSTIKIHARGTSGAERMLLKINGNTVAVFSNLATTLADYTYTETQTTTIDSLRVQFNEDGIYKGVDKNIVIDYVEVDGVKYQTEAKTVYSKGVWTRSTGCRAGFKKHDWLACNGWVEYRDAKGVVLAKSVLGASTDQPSSENEDAQSITTSGGSTISLREGSTISQLLTKGRDDGEMPTVEIGATGTEEDVRKVEGDIVLSVPKSVLEAVSSDKKTLVSYSLDGEPIGLGSFEAPGLKYDTRRVSNGSHKVTASFKTTDNKPLRDFAITLEVENEPNPVEEARDNGAPLIVLGSDHELKADLRGNVILTATPAIMEAGNGRLVYTVDGEPVGTTSTSRPELVLNTHDLDNGPHTLGVTVLGNEGVFSGFEMNISVDNSFTHTLSVWFSNRGFRVVLALGMLAGAAYVARPNLRSVFERKVSAAAAAAGNTRLFSGKSFAFAKMPVMGMVPAGALFIGSILAFALPGVAELSGSVGFLVEAETAIPTASTFTTGVDGTRTYVIMPKSGSSTTPTPPTPNPNPNPSPTPGTGSGTPITVEAETFSQYSDGTGNLGTGTCRSSDAPNADMKPTGSGGCTIGWIDPGDWYEWNVTAPTAGNYTLNLTYANGEVNPTSARFSVDGTQQLNPTNIPSTGNWDTLSSANVGVLTLKAGVNKVRFDQTGYIDLDVLTFTPGGSTTPTPTPTPPSPSPTPTPPPGSGYQTSLNLIKNFPYRNTKEDNSPYLNTPSAQLYDKPDLYGPYTDYMQGRGDYNGSEWFEQEYFPGSAAGVFRENCEVSHFSYDDPIVYPGQPGAAHLHMFFGNTYTNAYSTFDTILNSGGSTCNGRELNRTAYWAPAMFDGQGNVVVPSKTKFYYKTEFPAGIGKTVVYPDNLQIVADNTNNVPGNLDLSVFRCNTVYNGGKNTQSMTIPNCPGNTPSGQPGVLEYMIFFDYCWNGNTSTIGDWKANAGDGTNGNLVPPLRFWHSSECPSSHPKLLPALVTHIFYDIKPGENTSQWFLSSDVNPNTGLLDKARGSTAHADWFGGWNKQVNQEWINNCSNIQDAECAAGLLADPDSVSNPRALRLRNDWITGYGNPNSRIPVKAIFDGMCQYDKALDPANGYSQGAYCRP